MILQKYIIVYAYLLLVLGGAFAISKIFKNNEKSRNLIHISAGLGWIIYRLLFPATIHPIIISASFVVLTIMTTILKVDFVERKDGSLGTIFYTLAMFVMSVFGYQNPFLFDVFGIVIICLSCGDAAANIVGTAFGKTKIYKKKSLEGSIACVIVAGVAMMSIRLIFDIEISIGTIFILAILCSITELYSGTYDNVAIPTVLYVTSYILLKSGTDSRFWTSLCIGIAMWIFSLSLKLLSPSAAYMLFCMISVLYYFGGWKAYLVLMMIFIVVIIVEKSLGKRTEKIFYSINKEHGVRNEKQLISNCLVAVILICLSGITKNELFVVAYVATLAETIGDSVASDVGVLSKANPIDICSFKPVPRGISGGVSSIGTTCSIMVCIYSAIIYFWVYKQSLLNAVIVAVSAFLGILLDSVLGSKVQVQYKCKICGKLTEKECHCGEKTSYEKGMYFFDNSRINLICNIFSCGISCIVMALMG